MSNENRKHHTLQAGNDSETLRSGVPRRTALSAGLWATPVVILATAAPAAASSTSIEVTAAENVALNIWGTSTVTFSVMDQSGPINDANLLIWSDNLRETPEPVAITDGNATVALRPLTATTPATITLFATISGPTMDATRTLTIPLIDTTYLSNQGYIDAVNDREAATSQLIFGAFGASLDEGLEWELADLNGLLVDPIAAGEATLSGVLYVPVSLLGRTGESGNGQLQLTVTGADGQVAVHTHSFTATAASPSWYPTPDINFPFLPASANDGVRPYAGFLQDMPESVTGSIEAGLSTGITPYGTPVPHDASVWFESDDLADSSVLGSEIDPLPLTFGVIGGTPQQPTPRNVSTVQPTFTRKPDVPSGIIVGYIKIGTQVWSSEIEFGPFPKP